MLKLLSSMTDNRKHFWMIFIILAFAILLRIYFFSGIVCLDDFAYAENAYRLLHSGNYFNQISQYTTRIGLVFPVALFQASFGMNEWSLVLFSLICSVGTIFVVYLIGCQLFNKKVGLIAAFLLSFLPQHAILSTELLPDSIVPFFVALAFYLLLKQEKVNSDRIKYILCMLCGFFLFWAFQVREISIVFFLVCLIYAILQRKIKLRYVSILLSFLVFTLLLYLFYLEKGNFLWQIDGFKYHDQILKINPVSYQAAKIFDNLEWMFPLPAVLSRATSLNYFIKDFVFSHCVFGFFYYLFFIAFVYSLVHYRRNKQYIILASWFLVFLLYLEFGTTSLQEYSIIKRDRYLAFISPPAVLITAIGLQAFVINRRRKIVCGIVLFFFLISSVFYIRMGWQGNIKGIEKYRTTFSFLKSLDAKNIFVTDQIWSLRGRFYYKYREDVKFFFLDEHKPEEVEDYIIIDKEFKEYSEEIQGRWEFMGRFEDVAIYKASGRMNKEKKNKRLLK